MKRTIYYLSLSLLALTLSLASCKKKDTTPTTSNTTSNSNTSPEITQTYYLQSLQGGVWNTAQTNTKIYDFTATGFEWDYPLELSPEKDAILSIRCPGANHTYSKLQSLIGKDLSFTKSDSSIFVVYIWRDYSSNKTKSQTGSLCKITSVVPDGQDDGTHGNYKVTGTFNCNVALDGGTSQQAVTNGKFVIRVTEYFE